MTAPNAVIPGAPLGFHVSILDASSDVTIRTALKYAANGSVVVETTGKATEGTYISVATCYFRGEGDSFYHWCTEIYYSFI